MHMRPIISSSAACPALKYFSTLSHKRQDIREIKKAMNINACSDLLYNVCLKHFSFQEEMSEMWPKTCIGLHVKCSLFLSDF